MSIHSRLEYGIIFRHPLWMDLLPKMVRELKISAFEMGRDLRSFLRLGHDISRLHIARAPGKQMKARLAALPNVVESTCRVARCASELVVLAHLDRRIVIHHYTRRRIRDGT